MKTHDRHKRTLNCPEMEKHEDEGTKKLHGLSTAPVLTHPHELFAARATLTPVLGGRPADGTSVLRP